MNKEKYLAKRLQLMAEAQGLIDSVDIDGFNAKKAEVEKLDSDFENACTAQANLTALQDNTKITNIQSAGTNITGGTVFGYIRKHCRGRNRRYL